MPITRLVSLLLFCLFVGLLFRPGPGAEYPSKPPAERKNVHGEARGLGLACSFPSFAERRSGGLQWNAGAMPGSESAIFRNGLFGASSTGSQRAPSFLEIVLLAAALIIVFRIIRPRRRGGPPRTKSSKKEGEFDRQPYNDLWDKLRSEKKKGKERQIKPNLEPDPDENEFIRGAKATFARLTEAWDDRDLQDIQTFTTPEMLARFQEWAEGETRAQRTEILLLNARLMGVRQENGHEVASVYFDALVHRGDSDRPENLRQVWEFTRDPDDEESTWLLRSLEDVEQEPLQ